MWISNGQYHPLYNYTHITEPLYVEAWRYKNGMFMRMGSSMARLPMERRPSEPEPPIEMPPPVYPPQ